MAHRVLMYCRYGIREGYETVSKAMKRNGGDMTATAAELGVAETSLRRALMATERGAGIIKRLGLGRRGAALRAIRKRREYYTLTDNRQ